MERCLLIASWEMSAIVVQQPGRQSDPPWQQQWHNLGVPQLCIDIQDGEILHRTHATSRPGVMWSSK
jgi:hypothetical protein